MCLTTQVHVRHDSHVALERWPWQRHMTHSYARYGMPGTKLKGFRNNLKILCHFVCNSLYLWMSRALLRVNESYLAYEWVRRYYMWLSHMWQCLMNESCLPYEWIMSHVRTSHVSRTNESCLMYVLLTNESDAITCDSVTCNSAWLIHKQDIYETWLMRMWDMTHSWVRTNSFICGTCLTRGSRARATAVRHDSFVCETWLIHEWDMTHSYARHDSLVALERGPRHWDMTHSYRRHDPVICETWLVQKWNIWGTWLTSGSRLRVAVVRVAAVALGLVAKKNRRSTAHLLHIAPPAAVSPRVACCDARGVWVKRKETYKRDLQIWDRTQRTFTCTLKRDLQKRPTNMR